MKLKNTMTNIFAIGFWILLLALPLLPMVLLQYLLAMFANLVTVISWKFLLFLLCGNLITCLVSTLFPSLATKAENNKLSRLNPALDAIQTIIGGQISFKILSSAFAVESVSWLDGLLFASITAIVLLVISKLPSRAES